MSYAYKNQNLTTTKYSPLLVIMHKTGVTKKAKIRDLIILLGNQHSLKQNYPPIKDRDNTTKITRL